MSANASTNESDVEICVVELSGRSHNITGLNLSDTVKQVHAKLDTHLQEPQGRYGLVIGDHILGARDLNKNLQEVGIRDGMTVAIVRVSQSEVFESPELVGDENDVCSRGAEQSTVTHFAFASADTCILIRQTYARHTTGTFIWDICGGTYTLSDDGNVATCTWHQCHRRRRAGIEGYGGLSIYDSGWVRKEKVPEKWNQLHLSGGPWKRQTAMFQEREAILGIRLGGMGNCAEAIKLLALDRA